MSTSRLLPLLVLPTVLAASVVQLAETAQADQPSASPGVTVGTFPVQAAGFRFVLQAARATGRARLHDGSHAAQGLRLVSRVLR